MSPRPVGRTVLSPLQWKGQRIGGLAFAVGKPSAPAGIEPDLAMWISSLSRKEAVLGNGIERCITGSKK